jgi:hypothetical protein
MMIYGYVLERFLTHSLNRPFYARPLPQLKLAAVCRRIHHEVTYELYRRTDLSAQVSGCEYACLITWLRARTPVQRAALTRNPNITLELQISRYDCSWYAGWDAWTSTRFIGNIYELREGNRRRFLLLARLVNWATFISQPAFRDIRFKYRLGRGQFWRDWTREWQPKSLEVQHFHRILKQFIAPLWGESGLKANLGREQKGAVVREAENILKSLEESPDSKNMDFRQWHGRLTKVRESWIGDKGEDPK